MCEDENKKAVESDSSKKECAANRVCDPEEWFEQIEKCKVCGKLK